jgi:type I restriction-modification system DNA methylase subunit
MDIPVGHFAKGGSTADCGCGHKYDLGGGVDVAEPTTKFKYFKGINATYKNQFEINKAIEELVDSVPAENITPEEKAFISYFAGYGGLEKYGATGKGLLYEYFTPSEIAKKMWGLAYKYGFKGGHVLEPSCGIGEFIKYAPEPSMVTGYEINETSAKICRVLFPQSNIQSKYFETLFIKNNYTVKKNLQGVKKYQLVIGNPPYGSMGGIYAGMGEKSYTKSNNYIEYFISRGLDLLEKDGLLIYIIGTEVSAGGTPFLAQPMNPVKKSIFEKADLVDAYRLPNGLFETTDVLTDIVVFKKK